MAIAAPIAGAYTGTYNRSAAGAVAMNYTRQGFNLNFVQKGERIEETDLYGLCFIEMVYRGAQMTIDAIFKVYIATGGVTTGGVVGALWPWSTPLGSVYTAALPIAQLANNTPDVLILTAVANTPAAASPATLTSSVVLSPDNANAIRLDSVLREVPLRWDALLQDNAGSGSLFTCS